jgi:Methyltransferase domain
MRQAQQDPNRRPAFASSPLDRESLHRPILFGSESGIELQYPARLAWPSPWVGHIPFAFWLVEALQPRVVVELGVHSGNSYCAFLQAVQSLTLTAQCYGIDHWRGDDHADHYGDEIYGELCAHHDPLYGTFSTLIRATFEDALSYFSDASIDLLHIDGFHTYEAVAKDFSDWLPKMSERGVVLFHDINVHEREFGVWKFWEEIAARYQTLAFVHSHGLGIAYVGSDPPPPSLATLLALADADAIGRMRSYFARLGMSLIDRFARRQAEGVAGRVRASEAELEAARVEIRRHVDTVDASRIEIGKAAAHVAALQGELVTTRAEVARQTESAARLEQERAASQAEAARQTEAATRLQQELSASRVEAARQTEAATTLQQELFAASRAEASRQAGAVTRLQQELSAARAEVARQIDIVGPLQQQYAEATSELARHAHTASVSEAEAQKAADRIALLENELEATHSEIARQLVTADALRATADEVTEQVAALGEELARARGQASEAIAQRERATQLLRRQITATSALQRELAALRQNPALTALVNRLARIKHLIPTPVKQYIKRRFLGLRP